MEIITKKEGEVLIKSGEPLSRFYVILQGTVEQICSDLRLQLGPGGVVGLTDAFHKQYDSDYTALTDLVVSAVDYAGTDDFANIFDEQPVYIFGFAKGAFRQCASVFKSYENSRELAEWFYGITMEGYRSYLHLCNLMKMPHKRFVRINQLDSPDFSIGLADWELGYITCLNSIENKEIEAIYGKREEVVIGVIGTCCGYIDRATLALEEMVNYFVNNSEIVLSNSRTDLFSLYFDLKIRAAMIGRDTSEIDDKINDLYEFITQSGLFNSRLVAFKWKEYQEYDFAHVKVTIDGDTEVYKEEKAEDDSFEQKLIEWEESEYGAMYRGKPDMPEQQLFDGEVMLNRTGASEENLADGIITEEAEEVMGEELGEIEDEGLDCLAEILDYAGYDERQAQEIRERIKKLGGLADKEATDDATRRLRRAITDDFYNTYERVFFEAVGEFDVSPIIKMFLNFGFMDVALVGSEYAHELLELVDMLSLIQSANVYTIYSWLQAIYKGEKEPSKNELDMDYRAYIYEERSNGHIKEEDVKKWLENTEEKTRFEIRNFFKSGNRITSGKMSLFCPILCQDDFMSPPSRQLLKSSMIKDALERVKDVDFSIFFREIYFSDPEKGVKAEMLKKEVFPDIILMPNAGGRAMMWAECSGVKKDTPARFIFPLFASEEINKLMVPVCGAFRWEICRREQGTRWNDIASKCLTSDFYDYATFYKKNKDLSTEAKEKTKNLLKSSRNNMREAFSKVYATWIMYEALGSVRLNKVERDIMIKHCPFRKRYRAALESHPLFKDGLSRYNIQCKQKVTHLKNAFTKYEQNGGAVSEEMMNTLDFYDL